MAGVTTKEDVIEETIKRLPEFEPKIIRDVFDAHIKYIHEAVKNPEIFSIKLGQDLGRLYANYYLVEDDSNSVSKDRFILMKDEFDWSSKVFSPPILAKQLKHILKNKRVFKYTRNNVEKALKKIARITNEYYDQQTKGNS